MNLHSKKLLILCLMIFSISFSTDLSAAQLPWSTKIYSPFSDQEPLESLLKTLAASQNTQISVSKKIDDVVSVYFKEKTAKFIFKELVKAHGLIWYYDGDVLYVSKKDETQTGSVHLKYHTTKEFSQSLRQLGILDDHFYWMESVHDNTVYFKGPERFVSTVLKMANVLDKKPSKPRIYKWIDQNGVPTFSSSMPNRFNKSKNLDVIEVDHGVSMISDNNLDMHWVGDFSK